MKIINDLHIQWQTIYLILISFDFLFVMTSSVVINNFFIQGKWNQRKATKLMFRCGIIGVAFMIIIMTILCVLTI